MLSRLPPGMRYYIGAEARLRRFVEDSAMSVFEGWSYEEVLTPSVDYYALFEQGMGQAEAQRSFRFTDNDGRLLSLRPDVTSSIARVAATLLTARPRPLRLCYTAPVFRQQSPSHAEWRREHTQLGCELIGSNGLESDLEVLLVAREILQSIGLGDSSVITVNHAAIFNGLVLDLGLSDPARETVRRLVDTRDVTELRRYLSSCSVSNSATEALSILTSLNGKGEVLTEARKLPLTALSIEGVDSLSRLWATIDGLGLKDSFELDLADVSSLDYYTGISFRIFAHGIGYRVGRGGRYDGLTANFGKAEPAVGFVLSLDSLTELLARTASANGTNTNTTTTIENSDVKAKFSEAISRRQNRENIRIKSNA
jgi:ATP phosphoribosyltransferase regulatory subunit